MTQTTDQFQFQGYPVDLLLGLKGMGKNIIGDDTLYEAVRAYNDATVEGAGGSALGPALLTADASTVITSSTAHHVPAHIARPAPVAVVEADPSWDSYDLTALLAKVAQHGVTVDGRVKTPGKLIAALEAAGVKP